VPKRIRVFFINCPTLATDAAAHLILAQNKVQSAIQFEIHHFWIFGQVSQGPLPGRLNRILERLEDRFPRFGWLARHNRTLRELRAAPSFQQTLEHKVWYDQVAKAVGDYDYWFLNSGYYKYDFEQAPAIVITETPIAGKYLSYTREPFGLVSLAYWKAFFKPGSALEYMINNIQRLSLRLCYGSVGSHWPTRGCIWDFDVHQPDIRISAWLGLLCGTCHGNLRAATSEEEFREIENLIDNEWIGRRDDPFSVAASLAKHYNYELRRATGLSPGLFSSISLGMKTEGGKFFLDVLKWVVIALITIILASYFPDIHKNFRSN
jgi:hypothetical protein